MSKIDELKTLNILALAALAFHFITAEAWLVGVAAVLLLLAAVENPVAKMLVKLWLLFSKCLGQVTSRVLLCLIYFVFLLPIALLYRYFNRELYLYFYDRNKQTLFLDANKTYSPDSFENPW